MLPVASLVFVGSGIFGAAALKDFALALFVGLSTGAYSSIFIAAPILAWVKEREPKYRAVRERAQSQAAKAAERGDAAPVAGQRRAGPGPPPRRPSRPRRPDRAARPGSPPRADARPHRPLPPRPAPTVRGRRAPAPPAAASQASLSRPPAGRPSAGGRNWAS